MDNVKQKLKNKIKILKTAIGNDTETVFDVIILNYYKFQGDRVVSLLIFPRLFSYIYIRK